jgi:hypothetical protein
MHIKRPNTVSYLLKFQLSLIVVLLLVNVIFRVPFVPIVHFYSFYDIDIQELPEIDLTEITIQYAAPPAPVRPTVPISNFTEYVFNNVELDILFDLEITAPEILVNNQSSDSGGEIMERPGRSARVIRIVEPAVPEYVAQNNIRAVVEVTFTIGINGNIEDIIIDNISVFNRITRTYERVEGGLQGIVESTLQAAQQWQFRPAMDSGLAVRSKSTHVFTFGRE